MSEHQPDRGALHAGAGAGAGVVGVLALCVSTLATGAVWAADAVFAGVDTANMNRAEASGFDPTQLTPHGDLLWLLLHAAAVLCALTTVVLAAGVVRGVRAVRAVPGLRPVPGGRGQAPTSSDRTSEVAAAGAAGVDGADAGPLTPR